MHVAKGYNNSVVFLLSVFHIQGRIIWILDKDEVINWTSKV